eukprot:TRINITY_DN622_c0_g2_i1.p1 TRINITY_DN622_c0_g2~~TRINITY_DN622_c0_g2_i1.p1  ORF type:complete len:258 (-),score=53.71 TRINITY_DN622_c0_g2_i1:394-1167(-)
MLQPCRRYFLEHLWTLPEETTLVALVTGFVTARQDRGEFMVVILDDGTGSVSCKLNCNDMVRVGKEIDVGRLVTFQGEFVARRRGGDNVYRDLYVQRYEVHDDLNAEIYHHLTTFTEATKQPEPSEQRLKSVEEETKGVDVEVLRLNPRSRRLMLTRVRSLFIASLIDYIERKMCQDSIELSKILNHHKLKSLVDADPLAKEVVHEAQQGLEEVLILRPFVGANENGLYEINLDKLKDFKSFLLTEIRSILSKEAFD